METYDGVRNQVFAGMKTMERGDPKATADAVLKLVDAQDPPFRLILGKDGLPQARATYAKRIAGWEAWQSVSDAAQGTSAAHASHD